MWIEGLDTKWSFWKSIPMACPSQETAGTGGIGYIMLRDFLPDDYLKKSRMSQDSWIPLLIQNVPALYNCISVFWRLCKVFIFLKQFFILEKMTHYESF